MIEKNAKSIDTMTADIVSAYVKNNSISAKDLPELVKNIRKSLVGTPDIIASSDLEDLQNPAVDPKKSIHDHHITCLEDGLKFKSLKRHLMAYHGMTPEQYRAKWNLPDHYPMVAPAYGKKRSQLAKAMGLGLKAELT